MELRRFIKVCKPLAKAIACLESSQANPADVFIFWLAIISAVKLVIEDPSSGFTPDEAALIRAILNARFREVVLEGPHDCFLAAFYLNLRTSSLCSRPNWS